MPHGDNHCHAWTEQDKRIALNYLELKDIDPGDVGDFHAQTLNRTFGRSMTAASWRRTLRRWVAEVPAPYRTTDAAIELQELRDLRVRVRNVCEYLRRDGEHVCPEIILGYFEAGDVHDLFGAIQ